MRRIVAAVAVSLTAGSGAMAADTMPNIGIVVPGPNAHFDPWRTAATEASEDSGINATFSVLPTDAFNLTQENAQLDSLAARNYAGFALFPGDTNETNAQEAKLARQPAHRPEHPASHPGR